GAERMWDGTERRRVRVALLRDAHAFLINWQFWVAFASALITVGTFALQHHDELSWKRTEFLFAQAQFLETDTALVRIRGILEKRDPAVQIADIVDSTGRLNAENKRDLGNALDKY